MAIGRGGSAGSRRGRGRDEKRGGAWEGRGVMEGVRGGGAGAIVAVRGVQKGGGVEQRRVRVAEIDSGVVRKGCGKGRERRNGRR